MVKAVNPTAKQGIPVDADLEMSDVLELIRNAIEDKKGEDVRILDLTGQLEYLDYMIIATGQTELHNQAITDNVISVLARYDIIHDALNGYQHGDWILLDYGVLVVHVFKPERRGFYRLEELWAEARVV